MESEKLNCTKTEGWGATQPRRNQEKLLLVFFCESHRANKGFRVKEFPYRKWMGGGHIFHIKIETGFPSKTDVMLFLKKKLRVNRNVQKQAFGVEILALVIPYT